jgi:hypothetical protein
MNSNSSMTKRLCLVLKLLSHQSKGFHFCSVVCRAGKFYECVCCNDRIVVPTSLQERLVSWRHEQLRHPWGNCVEQTVHQYFTLPHLECSMVLSECKKCPNCQLNNYKNQLRNVKGCILQSTMKQIRWEALHVDLIRPQMIPR